MSIQDPEVIREILTRVKTIGLVGASDKPNRPSHEVMAYLQGRGYRVIPVNPKLAGRVLLGETVYPSLKSVPDTLDMAELFLASERTGPIMAEAASLGIPVIWLQVGVVNEEGAVDAQAKGCQVVMDRCPKQEIPRLGIPPMVR